MITKKYSLPSDKGAFLYRQNLEKGLDIKIMKYIKILFALTLLLGILTSCGKTINQNGISVTSTYPYLDRLTAGEYQYDEIDLLEDAQYPYIHCNCVVSEFYDQLVVTDKLYYDNKILDVSHVICTGNYWGDETGVFRQDENGDNEVLSTESLVGLIPYYNSFLAITGGINGGTLHCFSDNKHDTVSFDGMPEAYSYTYTNQKGDPPQIFYIATETALVCVDMTKDTKADIHAFQIQSFPVPDYWQYLDVNSMCELGDILYMGTQKGVLAFDTIHYDYTYYPVDYETVIHGEE
ncbi:MAG: hypothetical protein IJ489_08280 [Clostridia bacterium]|nr:hypothetical protein [Clostridia bacterium]